MAKDAHQRCAFLIDWCSNIWRMAERKLTVAHAIVVAGGNGYVEADPASEVLNEFRDVCQRDLHLAVGRMFESITERNG